MGGGRRFDARRGGGGPVAVAALLCLLVNLLPGRCNANAPPRFLLEDRDSSGGDLVVRLKEGPDTPPGTKILTLRAQDPDGDKLEFGFRGDRDLIRIESGARQGEAAVYLERMLDAETESEHQFLLTLTDGKLGAGRFITQSLLILVEDVNDNVPVFLPYPSSVSVPEHYGGTGAVIAEVEARDRDSGIFGQVLYDLSEASGDSSAFRIETTPDGKGVIRVVEELDYEQKSVYQLQVLARDRAANFGQVNTATAAILVRVEDVADQPPVFVSVPGVTRIAENVPRFTEVSCGFLSVRTK